MKRLLLVTATAKVSYLSYTLPRLAELARMAEADFQVRGLGVQGNYSLRDFAWLKLTELAKVVDEYDCIVVADADIMPNFLNLTKGDADQLFSGQMRMVQDHGVVLTDQRFVDWCQRKMPHPEKLYYDKIYYNSGLVCYNAEIARAITDEYELLKPIPIEKYHDQDYINWYIHTHDVSVNPLPVEFNWMAPQFTEASVRRHKLIHFAGPDKKHLIPMYDTILPRIPL